MGVQAESGECKTADDYATDFEKLSSYTSIVKTFAVSDCNTLQILGPAAEAANFQVIFGIWPTDSTHFDEEKAALQSYLPTISKDVVKVFTVGSEALYRGDLTPLELSEAIAEVKSLLADIKDKNGDSYSDVPVGTVDSWNIIVDGSTKPVIESSDFVFANAFSYWQGQTMQNASYSFFDDIMQALQTIQGYKGSTDIDFWVGETGWPTEGTSYENSVPSVANAKQFWQEAICSMLSWGVNVCVFETQDEGWKPDTSGTSDVEKHWGVYDSNFDLKYSLACAY